jgi:hypothetical protein
LGKYDESKEALVVKNGQANTPIDSVERIAQSVVDIYVKNDEGKMTMNGTGFAVGTQIVSCLHVVEGFDPKTLCCKLTTGEMCALGPYVGNKRADLVAFKKPSKSVNDEVVSLKSLKVTNDFTPRKTKATIIYKNENGLGCSSGSASLAEGSCVTHTISTMKGLSGSPIIEHKPGSPVIAIHMGARSTENLAISAKYLKSFLVSSAQFFFPSSGKGN